MTSSFRGSMKPCSAVAVFALVLLSVASVSAALPATPLIVMNGVVVRGNALIRNGTVLVPLRVVGKHLGAAVRWDTTTRTVTVSRAQIHIRVTMGSTVAEVDGRRAVLAAPAVVVGARVYVPLRFVAETFGARVTWESAPRTVRIRTSAAVGSPPGDSIIIFFAIVNMTGRPIQVNVSADGQELFERTVPATVPQPQPMPPLGPYPTAELKASLPREARQLRVLELTTGMNRAFDIAGFSTSGAGFRIVVSATGIEVKQDYYPIR